MCNLLNIHIFIINLLSKYYILDVIYINIIYLIYRQYICILHAYIHTCIYIYYIYLHILYEHIYIQYIYIIWIYTYVIYISTNYYI